MSEPSELVPLHLPEGAGPGGARAGRRGGVLSGLSTVVVVAFGICLSKLYLDQYIEIRRLKARRTEVEAQARDTRVRWEKLAEEVEYLETLEGVERLARDKLRYIRPDEVILVPLRSP